MCLCVNSTYATAQPLPRTTTGTKSLYAYEHTERNTRQFYILYLRTVSLKNSECQAFRTSTHAKYETRLKTNFALEILSEFKRVIVGALKENERERERESWHSILRAFQLFCYLACTLHILTTQTDVKFETSLEWAIFRLILPPRIHCSLKCAR